MKALAAAPAARPRGRWQGKVSPCRTRPGAAPWTQGSVPECATSHSQTHSTCTCHPDRRNQNMAPVHSPARHSRAHSAGAHMVPGTWCRYTQAGTQHLYTTPGQAQPGLPQPPHGTTGVDRPRGHSAPLYAIRHARQCQRPPVQLCPLGSRGTEETSTCPNRGAKLRGVSPRSPQGEGPAGLSARCGAVGTAEPPAATTGARHGEARHSHAHPGVHTDIFSPTL